MQAVLCLREREALRQRLSCSIAGVTSAAAAIARNDAARIPIRMNCAIAASVSLATHATGTN